MIYALLLTDALMINTMKLTEQLKAFLEEEGYTRLKEIEGRGVCGVKQFMFTWAIVYGLDEMGLRGRWCYNNAIEPVVYLETWDGKEDPPGNWIKYKGEGGERSRIPWNEKEEQT